MKFGIVTFPGSNCDDDFYRAVKDGLREEAVFLWHKEADLQGSQVVVLPGGFAHGDYLRAGAIARFSPIMREVLAFARSGGLILGMCNGFQILTEAGLLPGALLRNRSLKFLCRDVFLRVENAETAFTQCLRPGQVLKIPIAHGMGNYFADPETLARLEARGQVVFRYSSPEGELRDEDNPNGSIHAIAGISNETGNVLGMMPHLERAADALLGSADGLLILESVREALVQKSEIGNRKIGAVV